MSADHEGDSVVEPQAEAQESSNGQERLSTLRLETHAHTSMIR